ncbi:MAG: hypothetical protein NC204_02095 [Candidatus Amulumruptor caecigallinarius]|nr:hypothetical protein [Candidatus Amulumruptor caecigallinarius]
MKRILAICIAVTAIIFAGSHEKANASLRGEMALTVNGGYASYNNGGYMNLGLQYTFLPHFRITPEIGCVFSNEHRSAFIMSVDMQFPFKIMRGFEIYPLIGLTMNSWDYSPGGSATRVGGDFGVGFDLYVTKHLKFGFQGKYSAMSDTDGAFLGLGIGYVF